MENISELTQHIENISELTQHMENISELIQHIKNDIENEHHKHEQFGITHGKMLVKKNTTHSRMFVK